MWCENLGLEKWEEKYEDTEKYSYLHGFCHEFVKMKYQKNDKCIAILEYRNDSLCLMHSCLKRNNSFIDIRGQTTNFQDIIDAFDYGEYFVKEYESLNAFKKLLKQLKIE